MVALKDIAINTTVFLMFVNASAGVMVASGTAADMGVAPSIGGDEAISDANTQMQEIEASGGFASTLYGLYTSVTGPVQAVVGLIGGGPIILASVGVPNWLLQFIFVPQYLVVGGAIIYTLTSRAL
jgi:hypothetical protein